MAACRTCGAAIIWVKTAAGKSMPLDAKKLNVFVVDADTDTGGNSVATRIVAHESHFATCVDADLHRRR